MPLTREDFLVDRPALRLVGPVRSLGTARKRRYDQVDCSSSICPVEPPNPHPTSPTRLPVLRSSHIPALEDTLLAQEETPTRRSWTTSVTNFASKYTGILDWSYRYVFGLTQRLKIASVPVGITYKRRSVEIAPPIWTPCRKIPGAWPGTPSRQQGCIMPCERRQAVESPFSATQSSFIIYDERDMGSPPSTRLNNKSTTLATDETEGPTAPMRTSDITIDVANEAEEPTVLSQAIDAAPTHAIYRNRETRRNSKKNKRQRPLTIQEADNIFDQHTSIDDRQQALTIMDDNNKDVIIVDISPTSKPKKTARFVADSVITGRPHTTKTYHVGLAMHEVPADFYFHRRMAEADLETDWEASMPSPGYHFKKVMARPRDYTLSDDNVVDVLERLENFKPDTKQSSEEDLTNFFQRFSVGSISTKNEEEKAAAEAAKKAEEEKQARIVAEEAAKQKRIADEEAAKKAEEARKKREQEEREEAARRAEAAKHIIKPLSAGLDQKVDKVMKGTSPHVEVTPEPGTRLTRRDMGFILPTARFDDPSGWLNDDAINLYLTKLCEKAHANIGHPKDKKPSKFVAFSSHLISKVAKDGAKSVSRWAKRAGLASSDAILHTEKILFPCNLNSVHWTLLALTPKERKIEYFDSLGGTGTNEIKAVRAWLAESLQTLYEPDEWTEVHGNSARQSNGSDCGVFTVFNALAIIRGVEPKTAIRAELMPAARRQMVGTLISGGFVGEFGW